MGIYPVQEIIQEWINETPSAGQVMYRVEKLYDKEGPIVVNIYTTRPGVMIGKAGETVDKYREKLQEQLGKRKNRPIEVRIVEVSGCCSPKTEKEENE